MFLPNVKSIPISGAGTTYWVTDPNDTSTAPRVDAQLLWADLANTDKSLATMTITEGTWNGSSFTDGDRIGYIATHEGCTLTEFIFHTIRKRASNSATISPAISVVTTGTGVIGHLRIQDGAVQVS